MLREAGDKIERLQQTVAASLSPRSAPNPLIRSEAPPRKS
jgi:hypothetical protein